MAKNQIANLDAFALAECKLEGGQVLNYNTVKNYICAEADDSEILMFLELCKAQGLNPFVRDAYLVKYGKQKAQIIVGKDVFIKKAYASGKLSYMKAGIVVADKNRTITEREGTIKFDDEILLGGWCEVQRNDREYPIHHTVNFNEYVGRKADGSINSMWASKPCTMIRKVAQSQCLREAFPDELRGLYEEEEMGVDKKLPQKEIVPGMASTKQKQMIMALATQKDLFSYEDKDTTKLEEFCNSNGFNLKELKFDEVDELIALLDKYEPVQDVEYTEVEDSPADEPAVEQQTLL